MHSPSHFSPRLAKPGSFCLLVLTLLATGGNGSSAIVQRQETERRPNIVFIMVDDLGKEWVGAYGAEDAPTPHVDNLARTGLRFHNAYSMPQCTPTRATLLTGQYPFRHGWVNHWDVPRWGRGCHFDPDRNPSIGMVLKTAGYTTCIAGKWQINDFRVQPDVLTKLGFDEFCMWTGYESGNPASGKRYWDPYLFTATGSKTYTDQFGPDVCNKFILDFIRRQPNEQPFFVYYPMILTHGPLTTTPQHPQVTEKIDKHRAMVEYTDELVGNLIQTLNETGQRQQTIVVWTTDNGTSGGVSNRQHGRLVRGAKGKTLENGTCQPFIVNAPGLVPSDIDIYALTDFTDLLPTFAQLAGARLPEQQIDGRSLAAVYLGMDKQGPRKWIMAMGGGGGTYDQSGRVINRYHYRDRVIRNKRFKLYVETDRTSVKLVDLENDPVELNNVIDKPEFADVLSSLQAIERSFPDRDASPRYQPLPAQPWDVVQKNPGRVSGRHGLPSNARAARKRKK